jgi:hypothetical protein
MQVSTLEGFLTMVAVGAAAGALIVIIDVYLLPTFGLQF